MRDPRRDGVIKRSFRPVYDNSALMRFLALSFSPEPILKSKMENGNGTKYALNEPLAVADPEVHAILRAEKRRQGRISYLK